MNLVVLNHCQVTRTTTELAPPSPNYRITLTRGEYRGELFACRRGVYHVAREEARYREEAGHYMPGDFAEAADRATESEDSDPCYLRKCL
ncbi:hypothetical protein TNCV_4426051 [Trichonephila clavipes]|nr:hypothetical protein TNCV_4426051 [Trichonephila clavipes]